ncbi:MAG TPA: hypothetical protein VH593_23445 [Ktedonobacteraceae bacterium]|jgi:hypothetical protein
MYTSQVRKQARAFEPDVEEGDELYQTRMPSSVRRYRSQPPLHEEDDTHDPEFHVQQRRASRRAPLARSQSEVARRSTDALTPPRRLPMTPMLIGMAVMIVLVMSINVFSSWWQTYQNDIHYGRPRTYQMDAVVGHDDSPEHPTHFIFLNLNRHVEIIEIPGGDPSKTRIFVGPVLFGNGQDLTPVTGELRNDNGREDLIVHIQNQEIVFINDGTTFHAQ